MIASATKGSLVSVSGSIHDLQQPSSISLTISLEGKSVSIDTRDADDFLYLFLLISPACIVFMLGINPGFLTM
jgi:hypothetical protein